jgi:aryl-alcohol dehydrogenase-like predicted oxidoreductase
MLDASLFWRRWHGIPDPACRLLGRSGLRVTVPGFGLGGKSRAGAARGLSLAGQARLIRRAFDAGIRLFDSSEAYGNEALLAHALPPRLRDQCLISTKFSMDCTGPADLRHRLEQSLRRIKTDHIDLYLAHAVQPSDYPRLREDLVPELLRLRAEGKVRAIGLSERFELDPLHAMLGMALEDDWWDAALLGFSLIQPSAAHRIIPQARAQGRGLIGMFAVRTTLSQPAAWRAFIGSLITEGRLGPEWNAPPDPVHRLMREHGISGTVELGYRWAAHHPGLDSLLICTGRAGHLVDNMRAIARGPLPAAVLDRLETWFGPLTHSTGN